MKKIFILLSVAVIVLVYIYFHTHPARTFGANQKISQLTAYTAPISGDVLPINDTTNSATKQITVDNLFNISSSLFRVKDSSDTTKKVSFNISSVTTATTRTWAFPNFSDTFVGLTGTQVLSGKTFSDLVQVANLLSTGSSTLQNFTSVKSTTTNATTTSFGITGVTGCSGSSALNTDSNGTIVCGALSSASNAVVFYATTSKVEMGTTTVSFPSDIQAKEYLKITFDSVQPVIIGTTPSLKFLVNNDFGNKLSYRTSTGDGSSYNSANQTNVAYQMGVLSSPQIVHLEYTFRNATTSPKLMTYQGMTFSTSTGALTNYFGQVVYNRIGQATSTQFSFDDATGNTHWPVGTEIRVVGY